MGDKTGMSGLSAGAAAITETDKAKPRAMPCRSGGSEIFVISMIYKN